MRTPQTISEIIAGMWDRGYTVRTYPGGSRRMVHRWHWKKIKGSKPLRDAIVENITKNNALLAYLSRRP